uniref:C5 protein n=1 Tax=Chilli leaf curl virus TaxID=172278 RepID=A0A224L1I5_9GEMI|nr:c5 protein [Chilli leaf curl virus]
MSKRPADIIISTPASKVRRRLNFGSPYACRAAAPIVRVTKARAWANRPMNRKPTNSCVDLMTWPTLSFRSYYHPLLQYLWVSKAAQRHREHSRQPIPQVLRELDQKKKN